MGEKERGGEYNIYIYSVKFNPIFCVDRVVRCMLYSDSARRAEVREGRRMHDANAICDTM